jgi:hypothetical protein
MNSKYIKTVIVTGLAGMIFYFGAAHAGHTWNGYHWARTANLMPLKVIDSVSSDWQFELGESLTEWNASDALDMRVASANDSNRTRKQCKMKAGQMRVCNAAYGFNGWLGRATIGLDPNGHIDQGKAQMNDSYSSYWADPNEKRHVMCQEIGHVFGLGHTSEDGSSQATCMDYSMDPDSISPNPHDYSQLADMYAHFDSYNSYDDDGSDTGGDVCNAPPGKGCNKNNAGAGLGADGSPPMGVRVYKDEHEEVWVASRRDGGLWVHHVRLVPDAFRIIR